MRFIGNIEKDAQIRAVASGALPSGDAVIVNSDGTVSVISETSVSQSLGSPTTFESAETTDTSITYHAAAQKVVIAYRDAGNSNYGTAVVGTVSGTSISFGTRVVFESANTLDISATYHAVEQKIVIAYRDGGNSQRGTAIVGTVSGTSISFGSAVVFNSSGTYDISATYDSTNGKVVIAYRDDGNSGYGTAIVGTVSGTSISFGSEVVFQSSYAASESATYDSINGKVVIAYQNGGGSNYGTAIVGTVSGTSISFGSAAVFESSFTDQIFATYDSTNGKVVIAYRAGSNGKAVVGTVSGTSISFGTSAVFKTANAFFVAASYDSNAQKVVIAYQNGGDSNRGGISVGTVSGTSVSFTSSTQFAGGITGSVSATYDANAEKIVVSYADDSSGGFGKSVVFQPAYTTTNLTAENFIGFAAHTYADTQSALINSTCTVDRNQSGLTAGQTYYVQTDGTLSTTPDDPSVEAGTAISSTSIIVKG